MSLTGNATLVAASLLMLLCCAGLLAGWRRLDALGVARWPVRVLLLGWCQLTAVLLAGLLVNHAFVFYQSWSELVGVHPQVNRGSATAGSRDLALRPLLARDARAGRGTLVSLPIPGSKSGVNAGPATVYLPPQYGDPAYAGRTFPVVELLSGFPGGPRTWVHVLHVASLLDELIGSGRSAAFIAVIPVQNVASPRDTECVNVAHGPQVDTYLTADVRAAVLHAFRAAPSGSQWTVLGDSTGGYCATNLSFRHPDLFSAAVSIAGYDAAARDRTTGDLFGGSAALAEQNSPIWRMRHHQVPPLNLLLIATEPDRTAYRAARQMSLAATAPLRLWSLTLPSGGHNFSTFAAELPTAFGWLSRFVAAPLTPVPSVGGQLPQLVHRQAVSRPAAATPLAQHAGRRGGLGRAVSR
jgi:pimeloyl-ACP methyl ester carboxylesterase